MQSEWVKRELPCAIESKGSVPLNLSHGAPPHTEIHHLNFSYNEIITLTCWTTREHCWIRFYPVFLERRPNFYHIL